LATSVALRTVFPRFLLAAIFEISWRGQVYSRTRMRPSSKWISSGFHVGLVPSLPTSPPTSPRLRRSRRLRRSGKLRRTGWSMPSGSELDGFRGRLNHRLWRRNKTGRRETQDEEGFARTMDYDAHRDAATSGSFTVRLKPAYGSASSCLASCVLKSCLFQNVSTRGGRRGGGR